jgi:hypothetical protein
MFYWDIYSYTFSYLLLMQILIKEKSKNDPKNIKDNFHEINIIITKLRAIKNFALNEFGPI